MHDVLDNEPIVSKPKGKYFSYLSLLFGIATFLLVAFVVWAVSGFAKGMQPMTAIFSSVIYLRTACLLGIISTLVSFFRKEPASKVKLIGAVSNGLNVVLIVTIFLYVVFSDDSF